MLESVWVVAFHSIVIVMFTTFSLLFKCFLLYLLIYVALSCRLPSRSPQTHTHTRTLTRRQQQTPSLPTKWLPVCPLSDTDNRPCALTLVVDFLPPLKIRTLDRIPREKNSFCCVIFVTFFQAFVFGLFCFEMCRKNNVFCWNFAQFCCVRYLFCYY